MCEVKDGRGIGNCCCLLANYYELQMFGIYVVKVTKIWHVDSVGFLGL